MSLEWVLRLLQHYIESDPDQIFVIDLVPSLRYAKTMSGDVFS